MIYSYVLLFVVFNFIFTKKINFIIAEILKTITKSIRTNMLS